MAGIIEEIGCRMCSSCS